jgi:hypothetical protein
MSDPHYFHPEWISRSSDVLTVDLAVYGGTAAGIVCAIEAMRGGLNVVVLNPGKHVGGLTTGGLGWTDYGKQAVIGGQARELYRAMGRNSGRSELWHFAPSEASKVFDDWTAEARLDVRSCQYLDKVELSQGRIVAARFLGGLVVRAKVFVDATYEGDLLAAAGVEFHVGRESNSDYGETLNGIQIGGYHQFVPSEVSATGSDGRLLPGIEPDDLRPRKGQGDHRIQAYNFRVCMTDDPHLRIPWEKPAGYDPADYLLADRWYAGPKDHWNDHYRDAHPLVPVKFDILDNLTAAGHHKTDTNNHCPVSSDFVGGNWRWPTASHAERETIFQRHVAWQKGLYFHLANSSAIPDRYRAAVAHWGLSRDEFADTGGWSPQLYVREARRLVGDHVLTEHDCMLKVRCDDPVGMGSYNLDSHNCTRFATPEGKVLNEGDVQVPPAGPYGISYRCIVPKRGQCPNLLVPVCCSTSHIAYGSVRMEPVFMILGQSAAIAASLAIRDNLAVQDVAYARLRPMLEERAQVLGW